MDDVFTILLIGDCLWMLEQVVHLLVKNHLSNTTKNMKFKNIMQRKAVLSLVLRQSPPLPDPPLYITIFSALSRGRFKWLISGFWTFICKTMEKIGDIPLLFFFVISKHSPQWYYVTKTERKLCTFKVLYSSIHFFGFRWRTYIVKMTFPRSTGTTVK